MALRAVIPAEAGTQSMGWAPTFVGVTFTAEPRFKRNSLNKKVCRLSLSASGSSGNKLTSSSLNTAAQLGSRTMTGRLDSTGF